MDHIISKLLIYGSIPEDSILAHMGVICRDAREHTATKDELIQRCFREIKRLLIVSTDYAFDKNLWHNYIAYLLAMTETPFTLVSEKTGRVEGSVNGFVKNDMAVFKLLFDYDFSHVEARLGIDCFSVICNLNHG